MIPVINKIVAALKYNNIASVMLKSMDRGEIRRVDEIIAGAGLCLLWHDAG